MDRDFALDLLRHMVEIPSVSGEEGPLARYLVEIMADLGMRSYLDEVGNAVGEIDRGDGPLLLLLGHMDTVAGTIPVCQEGTLLYGRGTVDAKGALATFLCAGANLAPFLTGGKLVIIGAVEEEIFSSRGARAIVERYQPDAVLIGEPGGWSNVVQGYKGKVHFQYTVTCPSSHSAVPTPTAAELGTLFWANLAAYCQQINGERSIFYSLQPALLKFDGSSEKAQLDISCRTPPAFDDRAFQHRLFELQGQGQIVFQEMTPPVIAERTNPLIQTLLRTIARQGGTRPKLKLKTGTSDMNIVSQTWHVPMAAYGPGDSSLDHTPGEHIDLDEYWQAIGILSAGLRDVWPVLLAEKTRAAAESFPQVSGEPTAPSPSTGYTPEEEIEINCRLQALGYLE